MAEREKEPPQSAEDRLIERFFRPLARDPGAFDLADDAAIVRPPPGCDVVLTTDAIVGGVHFFPDDPAEGIGRKALRVNLSDLAAKGARPIGFLISLALPEGTGEDWLAAFAGGLGADAERYSCPLLGGDTVRSPGPVMVSVAAFGTLPHGTMVRRGGARSGDRVFVTGTIGDAALGLKLWRDRDAGRNLGLDARDRDHLIARYLTPEPRTALAEVVRTHASAAMDVSDGLAGDLAKLCTASGVGAEIAVAQVPLSEAAKAMVGVEPSLIETVLTGGDDYEILCAIPADRVAAFRADAARVHVPVTEIGRMAGAASSLRFRDANGKELTFARPSFSHF